MITDQKRERIYQAINDGWSTDRITKRFGVTPQSVAAFRAHVTMGTWKPARVAQPAAKRVVNRKPVARKPLARGKGARRVSRDGSFMSFSVPRENLNITYTDAGIARVKVSLVG